VIAKDSDGNQYLIFKNYDHFKQSGFAAGGDDENAQYGELQNYHPFLTNCVYRSADTIDTSKTSLNILNGFIEQNNWFVALSQKLIDLDTEDFYCLPCMAEYIGCSEDDLHIKIREFKEQGCTLFL